jgi:phosphoribosylformimino-5-aminoimidazole carboxamide ribotide isomerase
LDIIPAIDLRGGRCVRLFQGDYSQETVFSENPVDVALQWYGMGAPRLHLVDLDGAETGQPVNLDIVREITESVLIPCELGGGIRDLDTIQQCLQAGAERVILGTAAIEDRWLLTEACRRYGGAIVLGIDARNGYLATRGWKMQTEFKAIDLVREVTGSGLRRIIYTDIDRDGTLTEPNFSAIFELMQNTRLKVIASGGVSSLNHLKMLRQLEVEGAIVGKALYTGDLNLKQALDQVNRW